MYLQIELHLYEQDVFIEELAPNCFHSYNNMIGARSISPLRYAHPLMNATRPKY